MNVIQIKFDEIEDELKEMGIIGIIVPENPMTFKTLSVRNRAVDNFNSSFIAMEEIWYLDTC